MIRPIEYIEENAFIPVDEWVASREDSYFKHVKGAMILPVSQFFGIEGNDTLDYYILSTKRCYNSDEVRNHIAQYLNYFLKYYDKEKELLAIYYNLKYLIDYEPNYNKAAFIYDLRRYIFSGSIYLKANRMNTDNYSLKLKYTNTKNPGLQYNDKHAAILMEISLLMNMVIPLLTHFIYMKKVTNIQDFLLEVFDYILAIHEDVDIYNKLYETSMSSINKNRDTHSVLWNMQSIRGANTTTHSLYTVNNIILQIIPKYRYNSNIICFNYKSILKNIGFQVTDISYEYAFVSLSSSKRDADQNSEFDKFESHLTKLDESLYIQTKAMAEKTMETIELMFGPFDDDEVDYYYKKLADENDRVTINGFQKDMVFNLFYKYFGDPVALKAINIRDYIKLIIASKRILESNGMVVLPYIISSKVTRLVTRKSVNKKELSKLETSPYYTYIKEKYKNDKIEKHILSIIAIILSSEFEMIDYYDDELDGKKIDIISDYILEELLVYINLI